MQQAEVACEKVIFEVGRLMPRKCIACHAVLLEEADLAATYMDHGYGSLGSPQILCACTELSFCYILVCNKVICMMCAVLMHRLCKRTCFAGGVCLHAGPCNEPGMPCCQNATCNAQYLKCDTIEASMFCAPPLLPLHSCADFSALGFNAVF
jgi:hypothetical protein